MSRKLYKADKESDFVGMRIPNKTGGYYEILPWGGDKHPKSGVKFYPVKCKVCEEDKELYYKKFLIRKGDALCGYCPCGCSTSYFYDQYQVEVLVKRRCTELGLNFIGFYGTFIGTSSKLILHCPVHDFYSVTYNYPSLSKSRTGCYLCNTQKIVERRTKEIKEHLSTFDLIEGVSVFRNVGVVDSKGASREWLYICPKCSYDDYVKSGICSGVFRTTAGELQRGRLPCRCSYYQRIPFNIASYNISNKLKERGYTFIRWVDPYVDGNSLFEYLCVNGHKRVSNHHKFVTNNYGCKKCNAYGLYPERLGDIDTLYILCLYSEEEFFIKIGRSFDTKLRYKEYLKHYDLYELFTYEDSHKLIFEIEQKLHIAFEDYLMTPIHKFGGSSEECFSTPVVDLLPKTLKKLNVFTRSV